jgi:transglutaminase-like putative cysteine protease
MSSRWSWRLVRPQRGIEAKMKKTHGIIGAGIFAVCTAFSSPSLRADAPQWMHAAAAATSTLPEHDDKTEAILLYAEDVTTVNADGKTKRIERRVYKILRPEGKRYASAFAITGGDTKIGSMKAWCIPAQGKDYEVKDKDAIERSLSVFGGELVNDLKQRVLPIPAAEPGNVVGYEIEYQSRPYVLEDEWWIQHSIPVKEARYTLQMPAGWRFRSVWLNHAKVEPGESGSNEWRWVVTDEKAITPERRMPPFVGLAGRMIVSFQAPGANQQSGFLTWDDMGKWQRDLANGRRDLTPEISAKVAAVTADAKTSQQKMAGIAKFLQKEIRYVAIELGIGGWQPHSAADVLRHNYGDCKDKATLMSAMLKQAGIDSFYVIINTERGAVGPETPPAIGLFDHAILAIKLPEDVQTDRYPAILNHPKLGRILIFDPTDEKTAVGQLRSDLQGNFALLVTPEGGELIQTPQLPSVTNGISHIGHLTLDPSGTLRGQVSVTHRGDFAARERHEQSAVRSDSDRIKRIEQEVAHSIGMFQITSAQITNLDVTELPLGYNFNLVANLYGKQAGNLLTVRPRVLGVRTSDILEAKEPRKFPVMFAGPEKDFDVFEITLPAGYEVDDLPPPADVDYSFASYHSKTELQGNALRYTRIYEIKELSVPLSKMDELKKLYRLIAGDERNTAVLKPKS